MLKPGAIVRIRTLDEIIADHPDVQMKKVIQKWQNQICIVDWFKAVVPLGSDDKQICYQYKLHPINKPLSTKFDSFQSLLWFDYEIEPYNQQEVQEDAYLCLIGGAG